MKRYLPVLLLLGTAHAGSTLHKDTQAATSTANTNALCTAIAPYYWEIGNAQGVQASGAVGAAPTRDQVMPVASASKWVFGNYVDKLRGGKLSAVETAALNQTDGYTNGVDTCPVKDIAQCLLETGADGVHAFGYQVPGTVGAFDYSSGHFENLGLIEGLGSLTIGALSTAIGTQNGVTLTYNQPQLGGGVADSVAHYASFLQGILTAKPDLTAGAVCTHPHSTYGGTIPACPALYSPIPEDMHYAKGHWIEDGKANNGDGAASSAGAFGFYPWVDASETWYGIVARNDQKDSQAGYASLQCGRLIRRAWITGVKQTGTIPTL